MPRCNSCELHRELPTAGQRCRLRALITSAAIYHSLRARAASTRQNSNSGVRLALIMMTQEVKQTANIKLMQHSCSTHAALIQHSYARDLKFSALPSG